MSKDIVTIDIKPIPVSDIELRYTGAMTGLSYFNATGVELFITTRNGIITKLEPTYLNSEAGKLVIRSSLIYDDEESVSVPTDSHEEEVMGIYYDSFARSSEYRYNGKRTMCYDSVVTLESLREANGFLYIRNLDIVVSLIKNIDINIHPFTIAGGTRRLLQRIEDEKKEYTNISIKIIDNSGRLTTQYVKIAGVVQSITPVKNLKYKDGVYILNNKFVKSIDEDSKPNVSYASLDKHRSNHPNYKEPLIFKRYEDALNFKGVIEIERLKTERAERDFRKREMEYREREMKLRQKERDKDIEFKNMENEFKEKELKSKENILKLERSKRREEEKIDALRRQHTMDLTLERSRQAELELRLKEYQTRHSERELKHKEELMRLKEDYEKRSNDRKNTSELIRSAPVVITGLAAVAGVIYGTRNK